MTTLDLVQSASAGVGLKQYTPVGFSFGVSINQDYRSILADITDGDIRTARKFSNVICKAFTTIISLMFEIATSFILLTARDNGSLNLIALCKSIVYGKRCLFASLNPGYVHISRVFAFILCLKHE